MQLLMGILMVAGGLLIIPGILSAGLLLLVSDVLEFALNRQDKMGYVAFISLPSLFLGVCIRASIRTRRQLHSTSASGLLDRAARLLALAVPFLAIPGILGGIYVGMELRKEKMAFWVEDTQAMCRELAGGPEAAHSRCLDTAWTCIQQVHRNRPTSGYMNNDREESAARCLASKGS